MRIRRLWVQNLAGLNGKVAIEIPEQRVVVIAGDNGAGKSTLAGVMNILKEFRHTSIDSRLKRLLRSDGAGGPTYGCELEDGGRTVTIVKRFLQSPHVSFEEAGKQPLTGDQADRAILEFFRADDIAKSTLWNLALVKQGAQAAVYSGISRLVDVQPSSGDSSTGTSLADPQERALITAVEKEYAEFWTASGRAKTAAGCEGARLHELKQKRQDLAAEIGALKSRIKRVEDLKRRAEASNLMGFSVDEVRNAQEHLTRLTNLTQLRKSHAALVKAEEAYPDWASFDVEMWQQATDNYGAWIAAQAQPRVSLTALRDFRLGGGTNQQDVQSGQVIELNLNSSSEYEIADIVVLKIKPGGTSAVDYSAVKLYEEAMTRLGFTDFRAAQEAYLKANEARSCRSNLEFLLADHDLTEALADLSDLETWRELNSQLVEVAQTHQISTDAEESQRDYERELRGLQVDEVEMYLAEHEGRHYQLQEAIDDLELRADAAKLLNELKEAAKIRRDAQIAPILQEELDKLMPRVFGSGSKIALSKQMKIESVWLPESRDRQAPLTSRPVGELSGGEEEQLALLVRIAASAVYDTDSPLPLIFDDALNYSDDTRIRGIADVLERTEGGQVLIFTSQPKRLAAVNLKPDVEI